MSHSLLLISARPDDLAFATEVSKSAEIELVHEPDPQNAAALLKGEREYVLFVDADTEAKFAAFESAIQSSIGLFSEKLNSNLIHSLSSEPLEKTPFLFQGPLFGHFVARSYEDVRISGAHYGRIVQATLRKKVFGLKLLMRPEAKLQVVKLASTAQKQEAVEAVKNYLLAVKFQSRMALLIANAVDELLMNSMFDAPVDSMGRPLYAGTSRAIVMPLEGQAEVEMQVAFDGQFVAITSVDLFGSLDRSKVLSHLTKAYSKEKYQLKTAGAGAGLGLSQVFRTGGSLFFSSESQVRTEATVFFRRCENFRDFRNQFRFIGTQFYF